MEFVKLKSRAKINLTLDVISKREDGYHNLIMIMQTLSLYDSIFMKKLESDEIVVKTNLAYLPSDKNNIAYRAAELMKKEFGIKKGVFIDITKRIPVAAGLAGGSGNAAAVLKGMNTLFKLDLSEEKLMELGAGIGSDVPYCIMEGTALAEGRGEVLTRLKPCPHFYVVLAKPIAGVSTAYVFKNLDSGQVKEHPDTEAVIKAIEYGDGQAVAKGLLNVLETVTIPYRPIIQDIKDFFVNKGSVGVLMSGSGPTVFALFDNKKLADKAAEDVERKFKLKEVCSTEIYNCE